VADPRARPVATPTFAPPPGVLEIARRLDRAGHETWCVGGAVRDAILGIPNVDWDLATAATPDQVRALFRRTVPKGIEFGTVGVFDSHGVMHEVTTFRRDVETDGRHARVAFGASLDDDLARRDLTMNAIAYSPMERRLHDPYGGREDIERGVVRAVGDPDTRMREDRLRALRAIRFAARFGFEIEPATWRAIVDSAPHLGRLSAERVKEELTKTMEQAARPSLALRRWRESGAFAALVPTLGDVADVNLAAADALPPPRLPRRPFRVLLRLAALWLGSDRAAAEGSLRALRFSNQDVRAVADLADWWARLGESVRTALVGEEAAPDAALRRWARTTGRLRLAPFLRLAVARVCAERAADDAKVKEVRRRAASLYRRAVRVAYRDPVEAADLAVTGSDLVAAGIAPGPEVGRILALLLEAVVADPAENTRDRLLARARAAHAGGAG
jgi:tRNA nucleotidyltransferase (CCA-adding enzyme)